MDPASIRAGKGSRFCAAPNMLVMGAPRAAALGVNDFMKAKDKTVYAGLVEGLPAIVREFENHGTNEDKECLKYVIEEAAGESNLTFQGGHRRDEGRHGERLQYFVDHANSVAARLSAAHVVALRVYTTAAFRSLNSGLRDPSDGRNAHPFPVTIAFIKDAVSKLRAVESESGIARMDLWRGIANIDLSPRFLQVGGTELAPMSTTTDVGVAMRYALSANATLFKISTRSFMERGADLSYLSAFPAESEVLFPPLTFLQATGAQQRVMLEKGGEEYAFTVLEVEAAFPT